MYSTVPLCTKAIDFCSCLVQVRVDRIVRDKITEDIHQYNLNPSLANALMLHPTKIQSHRHPRQNSHRKVHFHRTEVFVTVHHWKQTENLVESRCVQSTVVAVVAWSHRES